MEYVVFNSITTSMAATTTSPTTTTKEWVIMSRLDWFWRWFIVTKIYTKGWGNPEDLKRIVLLRKQLGNRESLERVLPKDYPVYIDKETVSADGRLLEGHFLCPVNEHCPGIMPKEVETARFEMLLPNKWKTDLHPMCLHMGGTGDHGFGRRRRMMAKPLLKEHGIGSVILENPYYGCRKPKDQFRSSLHHVTDLFVMGAGLIMESSILLNWLDRQGYGPLGATGVSMGGYMASLGACSWHKPVSLIPCMAGSTASGVFTHGVLSTAIPWRILEKQYQDTDMFRQEIVDLIESPEPYWTSRRSMYQEGNDFIHKMEENGPADNTNQVNNGIQSLPEYLNVYRGKDDAAEKMKNQLELDCKHFMKGVMDECTHISNFSRPLDPELVIVVLAEDDQYVPHSGYMKHEEVWPGAKVRTVPGGHIMGFLGKREIFRQAIADSFALNTQKYFSPQLRQSS
ncbi:hypothetical protein DPMN_105614 [Dreissena polymorpha]|uniref:Protein ABHD18 n=1 Tax=Dreissena polymorpha TaxID=45954 RepID=A0A9D4K3J1_DREPO|nr:hypothetical protein DPMN_105614 [Dreissena polymorpha]